MNPSEFKYLVLGMAIGVVLTVVMSFGLRIVSPWLRSLLAGGQISIFHVIGMRLRGSPARLLVDTHLSLLHGAGIRVGIEEIETKFIAHRGQIANSQDLIDLILASRQTQSES